MIDNGEWRVLLIVLCLALKQFDTQERSFSKELMGSTFQLCRLEKLEEGHLCFDLCTTNLSSTS